MTARERAPIARVAMTLLREAERMPEGSDWRGRFQRSGETLRDLSREPASDCVGEWRLVHAQGAGACRKKGD